MKRIHHYIYIITAAILLGACSGNSGSSLSPLGGFTSNNPDGSGDCVNGVGNCSVVPKPIPPAEKKVPSITLSDVVDGKALVIVGNASSILVTVANADAPTVACTPNANVSLIPNITTPGSFLFYLGAMPNQDLTCVFSAKGASETATAQVVFSPAPDGYVEKLELRNIPSEDPDNPEAVGSSFELNNFYVRGFDPTTTVSADCSSKQALKLNPIVGKVGWFNTVIAGPKDYESSETCTFTAVRSSDGQKSTASITLKTGKKSVAAIIVPANFQNGAQLFMDFRKDNGVTHFITIVGPKYNNGDNRPQFWITSTEKKFPTVELSCTDANGAGFVPACDAVKICMEKQNYIQCDKTCIVDLYGNIDMGCDSKCFDGFVKPCAATACPTYPTSISNFAQSGLPANTQSFSATINYTNIGTMFTTDTCTVTATNTDGVKSTYDFPVLHNDHAILQTVSQLPPITVPAGTKVITPSFTVALYDAQKTKVGVICSQDKAAAVKPVASKAGSFFITTIAPSKAGETDVCTVTVVNDGIQTAYGTLIVTATSTISSGNFYSGAGLYLIPSDPIKNTGCMARTASNSTGKFPQVWVQKVNSDFPKMSVSCTDKHGGAFNINSYTALATVEGLSSDTQAHDIHILFDKLGELGTADTCTVTATYPNNFIQTYDMTVWNIGGPFQQKVPFLNDQVDPPATEVVKPLTTFTVTPFDAKTQLSAICTYGPGTVLSTNNPANPGEFYVSTMTPNVSGDINYCTISVVHDGLQTATTHLKVTAQ